MQQQTEMICPTCGHRSVPNDDIEAELNIAREEQMDLEAQCANINAETQILMEEIRQVLNEERNI